MAFCTNSVSIISVACLLAACCRAASDAPSTNVLLRQVTVELKNDLAIKGTLHSVNQYLNIKLNNIRVVNEQKYPHLVRRSPVLTPPGAAKHLDSACRQTRSVPNSVSTTSAVYVTQHGLHT